MEIRRIKNAIKVQKLRSVSNLRECTRCVTRDYLPEILVDVSYAGAKLSGRAREARRKYWRRENMSENLIWDRWNRGGAFLAADQAYLYTYLSIYLREQKKNVCVQVIYVLMQRKAKDDRRRLGGRGEMRKSKWSIDENDFLTQWLFSALHEIVTW